MRVTLSADGETVHILWERMRRTGGYCPCRTERTADTLCMCREFRELLADPSYEGPCGCRLYYKSR